MNTNIENAIRRGAELKDEISGAQTELRKINLYLAENAEYKNGSKTGKLVGAGFAVSVAKRDNIKWDQAKLAQVREYFPDTFNTAFKVECKPIAKELERAANNIPGFAKAVDWCREVKPGAPTVTYTMLDDEVPF